MPNTKTTVVTKISKKKIIIDKIKPLINVALEGFEKKKGEKKFEKSLNKVAKLLSTKLKDTGTGKKTGNSIKEKIEIITKPLIESSIEKFSKNEKQGKIKQKNTSQQLEQKKVK
jgi:hypothetical protein